MRVLSWLWVVFLPLIFAGLEHFCFLWSPIFSRSSGFLNPCRPFSRTCLNGENRLIILVSKIFFPHQFVPICMNLYPGWTLFGHQNLTRHSGRFSQLSSHYWTRCPPSGLRVIKSPATQFSLLYCSHLDSHAYLPYNPIQIETYYPKLVEYS